MAFTRYFAPPVGTGGRAACGSLDWASPLPDGPLPRIAVLVACHGALEHTKNLAASLSKNAGCEYELLLLDDACPDRTRQWAKAQGIPCLHFEKNVGLPTALNRGVEATDAPLVALWNNDLLIEPNGLRRLAQVALADGIAGQSGGYFHPGGKYATGTMDPAWADYPEGYCLTLRRDVWDDVGGWDPIFFPTNGDDSDWAIRARLKGHRFSLVPNVVQHVGQQSTGGVSGFSETVRKAQAILRDRYSRLGLGIRLLVKRRGALGDLLMMTPALRALRRRYPLCRLHVWCERGAAEALRGNPDVDAVFDRQPYPDGHEFQYTQVFDLNHGYEAGQVVGRWEHPARLFSRLVGEEYDSEGYAFHLPDGLRMAAKALLPEGQHLVAAGLRSACRPKANWQSREWLALVESLPPNTTLVALDAHPKPQLSPDGPNYRDRLFYAHPRVLDLTGKTASFREAAAVLSWCQECVSVDTGLLHAAQALGVPVRGLFAGVPSASRLLEGEGIDGSADCYPCQPGDGCGHLKDGHCLAAVRAADVVPLLNLPEFVRPLRSRRPRA